MQCWANLYTKKNLVGPSSRHTRDNLAIRQCDHQWGWRLEGCHGPAFRPLELEKGGNIRDLPVIVYPYRLPWRPIPPALVGAAQLRVSGNVSCWFIKHTVIIKITQGITSRPNAVSATNARFAFSGPVPLKCRVRIKRGLWKGSLRKADISCRKTYFTARKVGFSAQKVGFSAEEVPFQYLLFLLGFGLRRAVAKFIIPDWGDKVDSGIGLLYQPARQHRLAGR